MASSKSMLLGLNRVLKEMMLIIMTVIVTGIREITTKELVLNNGRLAKY